VEALAATAGLGPAAIVPNRLVPTFSLHVFARRRGASGVLPAGSVAHAARAAVDEWSARFRRLDAWLETRHARPLVVWGVGQAYDLLCAYSALGDADVAAAVDENLARFPEGSRPFAVMSLDAALERFADPDVLLTFVPPERVLERLARARIRFFAALSDDQVP
jgi:hypothetical protein